MVIKIMLFMFENLLISFYFHDDEIININSGKSAKNICITEVKFG